MEKDEMKELLECAILEDEMIFDHGPLIVGLREGPVRDRFDETEEE